MLPLTTAPQATDLHLPRPVAGAAWDPHTIHTHYFGFSIPEERIGCFIYVRYQPTFGVCGSGVSIFRGTDNHTVLDAEHLDYEVVSPWPEITGNVIRTANNLTIDFVEPGVAVTVAYESADGNASFDLRQTALTPLVARGHVMPGEEEHHEAATAGQAGGSEQFMRCTGSLTLHGETYAIDCNPVRDRSWSQVRTERRAAVQMPPIGWTPMYFGPDLALNQIGFEHPDTDPAWAGRYDLPADAPTHHFGYVVDGDAINVITDVRRHVLEYDPAEFVARRQELEVRDETGRTHRFSGEAIALCPVPAWPNLMAHDSVYRWTDESGRVSHQPYQEMWFDSYQRTMRGRARLRATAPPRPQPTTETKDHMLDHHTLPYPTDRIHVPPAGVENWSENLLVWAHDPGTGLSLWTHMGRMGHDPEIWEGVAYVLLPDGEVLANRAEGICPARAKIGTEYAYDPVWAGQTWHFHFDGLAKRASTAELSSRLIVNEPSERLSFDLVFEGLHPIFDYADEMGDQAWGTMHVEQGGTIRGTVRFRGNEYDIDCTGYRDHSAGPRNYRALESEEWVLCAFPSGRVFAAYHVLEEGRKNPMESGFIYEDGNVTKTQIVRMPDLDDFEGNPKRFEVVVSHDGEERALTGTMGDRYLPLTLTLPTGIATGIDTTSPHLVGVVEAPAVYEWDGETGYGWIERVRRIGSID